MPCLPVTSEKAGEHQVLHSSSFLGKSDISKVLLSADQPKLLLKPLHLVFLRTQWKLELSLLFLRLLDQDSWESTLNTDPKNLGLEHIKNDTTKTRPSRPFRQEGAL